MYRNHQPIISEYARRGPHEFSRVCSFVLLTIQQPLERIRKDLNEIESNGPNSAILWGMKFEAYRAIKNEADARFEACENIYHGYACPDTMATELLSYIITWPGFSLAKGGFIAQLIYGASGCLDSHNLARFNIPLNLTRVKKKALPRTKQRRAREYNTIVNKLGGTEHLWDSWCKYVASRSNFENAFEVSAEHCHALNLPT